LLKWLAQREWTEIKMTDWKMIGHINISREHLDPATFLYYLPSLLLGVIEEPGYLYWALEAIMLGEGSKAEGQVVGRAS
jgi:hypothetical protein